MLRPRARILKLLKFYIFQKILARAQKILRARITFFKTIFLKRIRLPISRWGTLSTVPELRSRYSKIERYTKLRRQVNQTHAANKNGRCTGAAHLLHVYLCI